MPTSEQCLEKPAYPTWSETVAKFPAKWRGAFADSTAKLVRIRDKGYLIDINGIDPEKLDALMATDGFRSSLTKLILPWAWKHPSGKPRFCYGISLNARIAEDFEPLKSIGAKLVLVQPRRFPCPVSVTETSS